MMDHLIAALHANDQGIMAAARTVSGANRVSCLSGTSIRKRYAKALDTDCV